MQGSQGRFHGIRVRFLFYLSEVFTVQVCGHGWKKVYNVSSNVHVYTRVTCLCIYWLINTLFYVEFVLEKVVES